MHVIRLSNYPIDTRGRNIQYQYSLTHDTIINDSDRTLHSATKPHQSRMEQKKQPASNCVCMTVNGKQGRGRKKIHGINNRIHALAPTTPNRSFNCHTVHLSAEL